MSNRRRPYMVEVSPDDGPGDPGCTPVSFSLRTFIDEEDRYEHERYLYFCFVYEYRHFTKHTPGSDRDFFNYTYVVMLRNALALIKPVGFRSLRTARYRHRWAVK